MSETNGVPSVIPPIIAPPIGPIPPPATPPRPPTPSPQTPNPPMFIPTPTPDIAAIIGLICPCTLLSDVMGCGKGVSGCVLVGALVVVLSVRVSGFDFPLHDVM